MGKPKTVQNPIMTSISLDKEYMDYIKSNRFNFAEFIRQAIKAHKENKFKYD